MKLRRRSIAIVACIAALLTVIPLIAQDELLAGTGEFAKGATDSSEVNLDKNMLGLAGKFAGDGENKGNAELVKKMDFVYVRSYTYSKPGQYKMADVEKITNRLSGGGWSHLVKERSATETTDVCVRTDEEGQFTEMVVISAEPTELSFVHLKGHLSLSELGKMGSSFGAAQAVSPLKTRPQ